MRSPYLVHGLLSGLLLVACAKDDAATDGGSGSDTDTGSGSETDPVTTTNPGSASNSGGNACVPGASVTCTCVDGSKGAQVCAPDGDSFGACECEGSSGSASEATTSPTEATTDPTNATIDPTTATTTDGTTTAGTTTDGTTTTEGSTTDTTTGGIVCEDPGPEPNEDEDSADDLGDQGCDDPDGQISGVLDGDADVDWSTFHSVDTMACGFNGNPFVTLTLTASDAVRLCVFADCDNGDPDFNCPMGTMDQDSPNGLPGCCGTGNMNFQFNCAGNPNESADFFVVVDQAPADSCVDYTVDYSFAPGM